MADDHAHLVVALLAQKLVAVEGLLDLVPPARVGGGLAGDEFLEFQQVGLGGGGERLGVLLVGAEDLRPELRVVHQRQHLRGDAVHVAVAALEQEGRLGAVFGGLPGRENVLAVDLEHHVAHNEELLHQRDVLGQLLHPVGAFELQVVARRAWARRMISYTSCWLRVARVESMGLDVRQFSM